jgi:hypothetical protein
MSGAYPVAVARLDYGSYLRSPHWRARRERALLRAGYRCQLCRTPQGLSVHHNTYANLWEEEDTDLVVLCDSCHGRHHGAMEEAPEEVPAGRYPGFWPVVAMSDGTLRKGPTAEVVGRWA